MGTIGIIYIICGILYMICCILDSPDIKQRWKKYIGTKLKDISNYFYTPIDLPPLKIEQTTFDSIRLYNQIMIDEYEIAHNRLNNDNRYMNYAIETCKRNLLEQVKDYINIKVDDNYYMGNKIVVSGSLYVGKKYE